LIVVSGSLFRESIVFVEKKRHVVDMGEIGKGKFAGKARLT